MNAHANDTAATAAPRHATPKQEQYLQRLVGDLGFDSVAAACRAIELDNPTTLEQTSRVISVLEARLAKHKGDLEPPAPNATEPRKSRFLTARALRRIDAGEASAPETLDDDAAWVLQRLARVRQAEAIFQTAEPTAGRNINQNGPILIETLVAHFGSIEAVASVFEVSVPTAKAWGTELPSARRWEAQVKTGNKVCA